MPCLTHCPIRFHTISLLSMITNLCERLFARAQPRKSTDAASRQILAKLSSPLNLHPVPLKGDSHIISANSHLFSALTIEQVTLIKGSILSARQQLPSPPQFVQTPLPPHTEHSFAINSLVFANSQNSEAATLEHPYPFPPMPFLSASNLNADRPPFRAANRKASFHF
jgi:hypothetical protein